MNKINELNEMLMMRLMVDLEDDVKCTPGLYQVIRGVINDNRADLEGLPREVMDELKEISTQAPFKFGG